MGTSIRKNIHFLLVDPQDSFASSGNDGREQGSLFVPGADQDMDRVAVLIDRVGEKLEDIHVTMDSHQVVHISNPIWFKNSRGEHPAPFTCITSADMINGTWTTTIAGNYNRTLKYLRDLESSKRTDGSQRYGHTIWPVHCVIGEPGWNVYPSVVKALRRWQENCYNTVDYVTKGSNPWTEHFSAIRAEVPDPKDPATQINTSLLNTIEQADEIVCAGIAGDICFLNTLEDMNDYFKDKNTIAKFVLLTDALPSIDNKRRDVFIDKMVKLGMKTSTTTSYLV